ncbi:enoyl-CoA hydratase/isomerase family protein [Paraburkholderia hospita]|uniref:3-hydroxybutyryl-CoA dehydratase n=1 Tax=Paraburkholderia hospita TaxID=169430 RepID=A0AAN1MKJ8_9BURK|nr:enoyl-CoA hydratase-related protein [Paraburkholderia hospita]AUT70465.1 enoyl-CoA hydratase [Paraburkholderia hospita]EIM99914.1 3-hydroxybutyryl-CoA dehydratase [Paraburkholderia hospita]OUL86275.1 enoyl-CoA hydratase [Paraburkholderia hospita]OUL88331.1 enoyl-CoA hydratase [Paraburkholderia hospita]SEH54657.1 E-phenylitaconyl-CoA hydratase [Paraburkholderia hospita]
MTIHYSVSDHVATVSLDRPEALNALDLDSLKDLRVALAEARDDDDVRVIVLTGAGRKSFCVGADLKNTLPPSTSFSSSFVRSIDRAAAEGIYVRLMDLSSLRLFKPVIGAINGYCLGGGLELALQCDLRIASTDAVFGLPEAVVASIPAVCGIQALQKAVPSAIAMKMLLTGCKIDAAYAERIGLISDLVAPEALMDKALELARTIASNGPLAVQMIKKVAETSSNVPLAQALEFTELAWGAMRDSDDRVEGRKAFAEKRKPQFKGR